MANIKKIIIMAGGTGGHVFPGLAIAKALQDKNIAVSWLGSNGGMETTLVPQHGIQLHTLSISGLRGKSLLSQLLFPFKLIKAIAQARCYLQEIKPDLVIGMGGFAAGPGGIAAKLLAIPLIIHEQNSIAGMTNRWLAKIATKVLCAFPQTFPHQAKVHITGNPVRQEIEDLSYANHNENLQLLIIGGSRGAQVLNEVVPEAISLLPEAIRPQICHQTGQAHYEVAKLNYEKNQVTASVLPFINDIANYYANTDIIICRAGALTLAEIMSVGIPAILIPYPHAVDDHQTRNAEYLVKNKAALLLAQSHLTADALAKLLTNLLLRSETRQAMSTAAKSLQFKNAVENIVTECLNI